MQGGIQPGVDAIATCTDTLLITPRETLELSVHLPACFREVEENPPENPEENYTDMRTYETLGLIWEPWTCITG